MAMPPEERYRNALLWIRTVAGLHYFGDAFDPEHMRAIANMAGNALDLGGRAIPDFEQRMAESREWASKRAAELGIELAGDDDSEET